MTAIYNVLERLDGVRDRGRGRWAARCPAHPDKSPSLSISETGDGTVLLHCFGGCEVHDVLTAIGFEMADLFPDRPEPRRSPGVSQHRLSAREALEIVKHECMVVAVAAASLIDGTATENDVLRVGEAVERIYEITGDSNGY